MTVDRIDESYKKARNILIDFMCNIHDALTIRDYLAKRPTKVAMQEVTAELFVTLEEKKAQGICTFH